METTLGNMQPASWKDFRKYIFLLEKERKKTGGGRKIKRKHLVASISKHLKHLCILKSKLLLRSLSVIPSSEPDSKYPVVTVIKCRYLVNYLAITEVNRSLLFFFPTVFNDLDMKSYFPFCLIFLISLVILRELSSCTVFTEFSRKRCLIFVR